VTSRWSENYNVGGPRRLCKATDQSLYVVWGSRGAEGGWCVAAPQGLTNLICDQVSMSWDASMHIVTYQVVLTPNNEPDD
jgi:hypothetical protein